MAIETGTPISPATSPLDAEFVAQHGEQLEQPARAKSVTTLVLFTSSTSFAIGLLGLITGAVAARLLGPQGRGELAAIQTWATCVATVANLGLPEALVYFSAKNKRDAGSYFASGAVFILLLSWLFVAVGMLAMPSLLAHHPAETIRGARYYLIFVPISALLTFAFGAFRSTNILRWNVIRSLPIAGWLCVLVGARLFGQHNALQIGLEYLLSLLFVCVIAAYELLRSIAGPWRPSTEKAGRMLRFGLPSILSTIPQIVNIRLDQLLIAALLPARALGLYVVAVAWGNIVSPLVSGLGAVLFPHVAGLPRLEDQQRTFALASRVGVLVCLVLALGLSAATPIGLPMIFGRQFAEVIPTALIFVIAASTAAFNTIVEEGLRGVGRPKAVMLAEVCGVVMTVTMLFLLLARIGIMGAALACLCGYSTVGVVLMLQTRRVTEKTYAELLLPGMDDARLLARQLASMSARLKAFRRPLA